MNVDDRRVEILKLLEQSEKPISGSYLSKLLGISRQVIVGDIAVIRASGKDIISTPKGYVINQLKDSDYILKIIACKHSKENVQDELNIIVDEGATVVNVIVEHEVYGQITGDLHLSSRRDISDFMKKLEKETINPLSQLTDGIHIHTIKCRDEEMFENIIEQLKKNNYIL